MNITRFAFIFGVVFTVLGVLSFVPVFVQAPMIDDPELVLFQGYGRLFGLFPVNILHNLLQLAIGIWGLIASKNLLASRRFCKANSILMAVFTIIGLIPVFNTLFGFVPMFGHDVWLHALAAISCAYYAYAPLRQQVGI